MKNTFKINLSTRLQIAVLIAIASILVATGAYFIYSYQANRTLQAKEKTLTAIATLKSKQLSDWFFDELNDIQVFANDSFLAEEVKKTLRSNALADKSRLTKFLSQIKIEHDYKDVIIASADGKLEIWDGEQPGVLNDVELRTIEKAFIQKNSLSTDLFRHKANGEEKIYISFISVIKDADNNVLAALIGRFDASLSLYPIIEEWPIPSQTAESFLFRLEADSILYLNNLQHNNIKALSLRIPIKNTELLASQAVSGKLGLVAGKDYRNIDVTGIVSKVEGTPWYLISKIDDSEMYQGKYVIAGVVAGLALLLIFIITFFIGFIYKRRQKNIFKELYIKESEVWQQQEKFKVTMDSLGEGVIVTDMDAKVQYINKHAEALTGWSLGDARERKLGEVYPLKNEETGEKENNILEKVIKQGVIKELANHTLLVSKNGKEIPVMDTGAPIFDAKGSLTGIVISFQDETEKRAQNRLIKESEQNLREFFENDISGDYTATADGKILKCNPAFARILGYSSPDELVGRNIKEFYRNPVDREAFLKKIQVSKILNNFEMILNHKEGLEIFCKENIVGVFDASGNLVRYFGYLQDITQQRVAEDELQIREQLLSSVMETQQELICRFLPDTTLTFVNKAYCKIFGKTEEELLGQKFLELIPKSEWDQELSILRSLNTNNPQRTSVSKSFREDSSEITLEFTDTAIFNEEGELVEFQSVGHDITEKLKTDQKILYNSQMQEVLREISTIFINIPVDQINSEIQKSLEKIGHFIEADRVYIFDYDWFKNTCSNTIEWCQDGIDPQIQVLQNIPLDEIPQWTDLHRNGQPLHIPDVFKLDVNDGLRQILEPLGIKSLLTVPLINDNECLGFLGFDSERKHHSYTQSEEKFLSIFVQLILNIRNRQILENSLVLEKEKAKESDKLKTAFINNISHEIRTPLNAIMGLGQFLVGSELSEEERRKFFEQIEKSSHRLMDTVTDYMDIAMLVSNTMQVNKKEFALEPVFEMISEKIKPLCIANDIKFEVEIPIESKGLIVNSDPEFLKKILDKLINNALKFTKEGSITCGYRIIENQIEFFVKDTGSGIDNDMQDSIFEMFRQEDSSTTRGHEGSGLGLTIAKELVTLLGGEIFVVSEKGKGSEFTFNIPINNAEKSILPDAIDKTKTKSTKTPLILIAEDDENNYLFLEAVLDSLGYNYIHAVNGKEAVDFCRQNPEISIVLMDIKMPVLDGDEATKQIRVFRPELPIIATTAYAQTGDEHRFLEAGCNDYLPKPIKKEKLLAIIRKYVE